MTQVIMAKSKKYGDREILVDEDDYERLSKYKWNLQKRRTIFYAIRDTLTEDGRDSTVAMHREIMGFPATNIDHKDRNGLNNQKSNLRLATTRQNTFNSKVYCNNQSGYKGVSWCKHNERWRAQVSGKLIGWFNSKEKAAEAYDKYVLENFREFARPNFKE